MIFSMFLYKMNYNRVKGEGKNLISDNRKYFLLSYITFYAKNGEHC